MYRTHTCGELNKKHEGKSVTLSGWVHRRRDHGGLIFIDLRDKYGITQVTFNPDNNKEAHGAADKLRSEFVIKVTGEVKARPGTMVNKNLPTGEVELMVNNLELISAAKALPFEVDTDGRDINEDARLKWRFLDLRRERMRDNILFRAKVIKFLRDWMYDHGFSEFETPILTASSPEGARDFLVPSRLHPGKFYALPQAPQQFKQLLMISGFDRYFQVAPCFRDEAARADRSPGEFYQLDVETSFLTQEEFFQLMEPLFKDVSKVMAPHKKIMWDNFPRIPYHQAMLEYGSDKPDLRFEMKIQDVSALVKDCGFTVFSDAIKNKGVVRCLVASKAGEFTRSQIDELTEFVKGHGAKGLAYIVVSKEGLKSPLLKFLGDEFAAKLTQTVGAKPGDIVFFGADKENNVCKALGQLRLELGKRLNLIDKNLLGWAWIVDFPFYEWNEEDNKLDFAHNPFSMPQGGMDSLLNKDPLSIPAHQYDIICNGIELSSGAVRNHKPDIMYKAFELVGYDKSEVDKRFGHMIKAFEYGAPPHCGFAPGIDRLVMLLRDEPNIREITAFPKNGKAEDLLMGAPNEAREKQLKELHIKLDLPKTK